MLMMLMFIFGFWWGKTEREWERRATEGERWRWIVKNREGDRIGRAICFRNCRILNVGGYMGSSSWLFSLYLFFFRFSIFEGKTEGFKRTR